MKAAGSSRGKLVALESHLLDRVQAAVLVTDFSGVIVYANSYCEILYGRSPDEIVGQNGLNWATDPIRPEVMTEIGEAILNGRKASSASPAKTAPPLTYTPSIHPCSTTTAKCRV
jgi:PAS domain-containing protein